MTNITAAMVKELRETTSAGMLDCKKALTETDGDMEKAVDWLRKKGLASAAKKASRIAAEGLVAVAVEGNKGAVVEVNSETDFVAKNEIFQEYVQDAALVALMSSGEVCNMKTFQCPKVHKSFEERLTDMIAKIGENMNIRRFEKLTQENGMIVPYIHAGGKIGVLVSAVTDKPGAEVEECLKNVAMQVAAMNPKYLSSDDVSEDYKEKEKEVLLAQAKNDPKNEGKPDNIIEKMILGRLNKELKEVCLTEQVYVKAENKETVAKYVEAVAKANGCQITLDKFIRFETGEGLEKKEEDFAAEVAAQMK